MSEKPLSVYQAAEQLGVSVHTVRRWCKDFAAYLDDGAKPEMGTSRRLSPKDMQVLGDVARYRSDKLSPALINERLKETVYAAPLTEVPYAAQEVPGAAQTALIVVEVLQNVVNPLEARLQALEQAQTSPDTIEARQTETEIRLQDLENTYRTAWSRIQAMDAQRMRIDVIWIATAAFIAGLVVGLAVWMLQ